MISYYTTNIIIVWLALLIHCVLVHENTRLSDFQKKKYYLTCIMIFLASLAEWGGIQLNAKEGVPVFIIRLVHACDYVFTPMAGASFIGTMNLKNIWTKILNVVIVGNVILQIVCLFNNWMLKIDGDANYSHGPLYTVYIIEYLIIVGIVVIEFLIYGQNFKRQNRVSLYLALIFVLFGVFVQESIGGEIRTAYIVLTVGSYMMFIHTSEFSQQLSDEYIRKQQIQIRKDPLTGLLSRYAYSQALEQYKIDMPENFCAFSIDVNGLKTINDTMGHEAGDEMICAAAECLAAIFQNDGSVFRTGGDEFVVLVRMDKVAADLAVDRIHEEAKRWKGSFAPSLSMSVGYSLLAEHTDFSCEKLVENADLMMYKDKEEYYRKNGIERRKT